MRKKQQEIILCFAPEHFHIEPRVKLVAKIPENVEAHHQIVDQPLKQAVVQHEIAAGLAAAQALQDIGVIEVPEHRQNRVGIGAPAVPQVRHPVALFERRRPVLLLQRHILVPGVDIFFGERGSLFDVR